VTDNAGAVLWSANLDPYGNPFSSVGTAQTNYGFTGEYGLPGGLLHLRARNYHPGLGVFASQDTFEGSRDRAMSLNWYSWVEGNTPNFTDPSGYCLQPTICEALWRSGASYRQILISDCIEIAGCSTYPGWVPSSRSWSPSGYTDYCQNPRTLHPFGIATVPELSAWWSSLSNTEKEIEHALLATNTEVCRGAAQFRHLPEHTFDFVTGWLTSKKILIDGYAGIFGVRPALIAGILASEMLFDYDSNDQLSDAVLVYSPNGGWGYANPHADTRSIANQYVQGIADSLAYSDLASSMSSSIVGRDVPTAAFLTTADGAIISVAVIARFLSDNFFGTSPNSLGVLHRPTPHQMGIIWTAYRAGVAELTPGGLAYETVREFRTAQGSCNTTLSLPVMRYVDTNFA
jgi:RHS repeat-associated protein